MQGRSPNLKTDLDRVALIAHNLYTSTQTGSGVDVSGRVGIGIVKLKGGDGTGTSPTADVELQESSDNGSSDAFATLQDIDGNDADFTQLTDSNTAAVRDQEIFIDLDGKERYIRALATLANAQSGGFVLGVELICVPKVMPGAKS